MAFSVKQSTVVCSVAWAAAQGTWTRKRPLQHSWTVIEKLVPFLCSGEVLEDDDIWKQKKRSCWVLQDISQCVGALLKWLFFTLWLWGKQSDSLFYIESECDFSRRLGCLENSSDCFILFTYPFAFGPRDSFWLSWLKWCYLHWVTIDLWGRIASAERCDRLRADLPWEVPGKGRTHTSWQEPLNSAGTSDDAGSSAPP